MVIQTTLFPPPVRDTTISDALRRYLFSLQMLGPLNEVDTSAGNVVIALPQAGLTDTETGQSNQNQELIFVKTSPDGHTVTITGAVGGSQVLTAQTPAAGSCVRFKSNASVWYVVGKL